MKHKAKILILDDDMHVLLSLRILLEQHYHDVRAINHPMQIDTALEENDFDVVVLDMNFKPGIASGQDGLVILQKIKKSSPTTKVILITAYGDIELAVEAMRLGGFDFIIKPWQNEKLLNSVAAALQLKRSEERVSQLEAREEVLKDMLDATFNEIIGESAAIQAVFDQIEKVAKTNANVLITGENGTGKELVARAIHKRSARASNVFMNVDMGAISESLFESELFGHLKGAFTDAHQDRIGKLEAAQGGTVFLDEIGNLVPTLQAKLLRVIQDQKVTRVGDNKEVSLDIRFICATNANLTQMVQEEDFRQDLLFRINTIEIKLPPLRERLEDIELLAKHFIDRYKVKYGKKGLFVTDSIYSRLKKYDWPGNIRELEHCIERGIIMSDGKQLLVGDLNLSNENSSSDVPFSSFDLEEIESWAISSAIRKHQGNISHAAKELGLSRGAMYRRMEKYGL